MCRCELDYKADHWRTAAFELWCWRRLLRVPWTARGSNQSILKKISPNIHWKDWCWSWNSNTMATWWEELTHWKRPWCWERLKAGGDRNDRGWDGWIVSSTQWTWVWVNPGSWWWTGRPGVLQSVGSPRVGHGWGTELNWMTHLKALFMCWGHWQICPYEILLAVEKAKKRQQKVSRISADTVGKATPLVQEAA